MWGSKSVKQTPLPLAIFSLGIAVTYQNFPNYLISATDLLFIGIMSVVFIPVRQFNGIVSTAARTVIGILLILLGLQLSIWTSGGGTLTAQGKTLVSNGWITPIGLWNYGAKYILSAVFGGLFCLTYSYLWRK